jgi:bacteriocin biosynthesis cyclodehydratase domain-containing protein
MLAPWCRIVSDRGRVLLEHGATVVTLEGRGAATLMPELLPLLDGSRTVDELEETMGRPIAPAVERALTLLAENNLLLDGPQASRAADPVTAAATFAAAVTRRVAPDVAREALVTATVAVLGSGLNAAEIARQLELTGVERVEALAFGAARADGAFLIAAPDSHEVAHLEGLNEMLLQRGQAWLQVLPYDGRQLVVGPLILPGTSACRACFSLRRAACSGYEDDFDLVETAPARAPMPSPIVSVAAGVAALLAVRWLTARDVSLPGRLYSFEAGPVLRLTHHLVLRVPRCTVCGPSTARAVPLPWFREGP